MRYRTLIPSVVIAGLLFVWAGCDSFLEPNPESFATTANFYTQPEDFELAVNGVYTQMRFLIAVEDDSEEYLFATDRRGPTLTKHFDVNLPNTVAGDPQTDEWTMTASNQNSIDLWNKTYDLIKEANVVINRIEPVEFEDGNQKARITGEAKAMRAFAYWFAVQNWGGVPLVLQDARTPAEGVPEGGRASAQEVYQQIVTDLQDAIGALPVSYPGGQTGKITRGAAKMLLGRTYLLTGDYESALSEFEDLDSGQFPYMLLDDFRSIFSPGNKNNAESVWEIQYNPNLAGQPEFGAFDNFLPFNSAADLLPAGVPQFVPNGNLMPTPDVIESCEAPYSYACSEADDERLEEGIAWYVKEGNSGFPEIAWPPRTANAAAGDSLPYLNKFYWPSFSNSEGEVNNNWILFRFADVLLSAAEAHWRLNQPGMAEGYLNRVRARSELGPVDLSNFSGDWTGDPLGDAILHERAQELLGEGHFWFDLKRFGSDVAIRVMEAHGDKFRARDPKVTPQMYIIEEFKLLYPIPPRDIDLADLSQNPGW